MTKQNSCQCKCQGACGCSGPTKGSAPAMANKSAPGNTFIQKLLALTPKETLHEVATDSWVQTMLKSESGAADDDGDTRILDQEVGAGSLKVPPEGQILTGPQQASSGAGAEKMIGQYSNPDPQQDIVQKYEALSRELGSVRAYMKSMTEAFVALVRKADDEGGEKDEAKDDDKEVEVEVADEIEDEDSEKEADKANAASGPVKAASVLYKAAMELDRRVRAARKAGQLDRVRDLKGKIETTLLKALGMIAKATDGAALRADIHAHALLKGMAAVVAKAEEGCDEDEKKESDEAPALGKAEGEMLEAGAKEAHDNQTTWPNGKGEQDPADVMKGKLEEVLKGMAMYQGQVKDLMSIVAGQSRPQSLPFAELAKSETGAASTTDPRVLIKSNPEAWEMSKYNAIADAVADGTFSSIEDEFASNQIMGLYQAARAGSVEPGMVMARVRAASEPVRAMFSELLTA